MAKKLAVTAVFFILVIGLYAIFATTLPNIACEAQPINLAMPPAAERQIWGANGFSQEFIAPHNGLNRLDIFFQTYFRQNTQDVTIRLLEVSKVENIERFHTTFIPVDISAQGWQTFSMPPIPESAQKNYIITIESPQSSPGNAVTVGGILEADPYQLGKAFIGATPLNGDIAFRTCYQMSGLEKIDELSRQLTQHRPGVWGNPIFYGAIVVVYFALIIGLFWVLAKLVLAQ